MKFLIPSVLIVAAVNAGPLVNSTENVADATIIDMTTSAPPDASEKSSDILQSKAADLHYGPVNILDNPSYNPDLLNSVITNFPIQQYSNNYSPYYGYPNQPPTRAVTFGAPLYPYAVQTGYEGILVPSDKKGEPGVHALSTVWTEIFPGTVAGWIAKLITVVISAVGLMFFGGVVSTAFCSVTSLCYKSLSELPFFRSMENVSKTVGEEVTVERVRRAAGILQSALDKYEQFQTLSDLVGNGKK